MYYEHPDALFQAASDGLISSSVPFSLPREQGDVSGEVAERDNHESLRKSSGSGAPPPRPPPPGHTPSCGSKSALDDLNDSIRVAMGSPARPPPVCAPSQVPPGIQPYIQTFPSQIPPQIYGSPVKFSPLPPGKCAS